MISIYEGTLSFLSNGHSSGSGPAFETELRLLIFNLSSGSRQNAQLRLRFLIFSPNRRARLALKCSVSLVQPPHKCIFTSWLNFYGQLYHKRRNIQFILYSFPDTGNNPSLRSFSLKMDEGNLTMWSFK